MSCTEVFYCTVVWIFDALRLPTVSRTERCVHLPVAAGSNKKHKIKPVVASPVEWTFGQEAESGKQNPEQGVRHRFCLGIYTANLFLMGIPGGNWRMRISYSRLVIVPIEVWIQPEMRLWWRLTIYLQRNTVSFPANENIALQIGDLSNCNLHTVGNPTAVVLDRETFVEFTTYSPSI